ncbi:hypothetical protein CF336_g6968 [Tilletia laevis]|uniref:Tc1-like transposase DDE domain-containing protein n=2 Tax=Tilletia TaxID=13289 RepID=A0A8T8T221_9BASI|nr:hypothetical protein CF336_g6968 [Tilletia laevis]KAE8191464.1 hypothetical protein CF335_g6081 [Tilletia laevis]KAE8252658.1 hypothetical protein A4X03_0g6107 [Tilletia caries]
MGRVRKSTEFKKFVGVQLRAGVPIKQLSSTSLIGRSSIYRAADEIRRTGSIREPLKSIGRPSKSSTGDKAWIIFLLRHRPTFYLDELATMLLTYIGTKDGKPPHKSTISRWLKAAKISIKKLTRMARQRNQARRGQFSIRMAQYTPSQLVFADETHFNHRNALREYGWAPSNERAPIVTNFNRGGRWTLLPALSEDGLLAPLVVSGSINKERFLFWLEFFLLPQMNRFPGPRSVLIVDNASIHRSEEVRDLMEQAGE